jgi:hypothetical protein
MAVTRQSPGVSPGIGPIPLQIPDVKLGDQGQRPGEGHGRQALGAAIVIDERS